MNGSVAKLPEALFTASINSGPTTPATPHANRIGPQMLPTFLAPNPKPAARQQPPPDRQQHARP